MKADLHVHSSASDGTLSPQALVKMALDEGVSVLAIADHDSVEGVQAALDAADSEVLVVIPAVELSASDDGTDVHVLGYFIDHLDRALTQHLAAMRRARLERAKIMVGALADAGYDVTVEDVLRFSEGGAVGRSHVARALVEKGISPSIREAFQQLIGHGRPFYVSKAALTPEESIRVIHDAGGFAVAAHPGVNGLSDQFLSQLIEVGLDGIEAYHADHDQEQRRHFSEFAGSHGLLVTGGTDYHGPEAPNPRLGSVEIPPEAVAELLARKPLP